MICWLHYKLLLLFKQIHSGITKPFVSTFTSGSGQCQFKITTAAISRSDDEFSHQNLQTFLPLALTLWCKKTKWLLNNILEFRCFGQFVVTLKKYLPRHSLFFRICNSRAEMHSTTKHALITSWPAMWFLLAFMPPISTLLQNMYIGIPISKVLRRSDYWIKAYREFFSALIFQNDTKPKNEFLRFTMRELYITQFPVSLD